MLYLSKEYRLNPVEPAVYDQESERIGVLKLTNTFEDTAKRATDGQDTAVIDMLMQVSDILTRSYGRGGGLYSLAAFTGLAVLCRSNPDVSVNLARDWPEMIKREEELGARPGIHSVEQQAGIALLEIEDVNPGYVEGYRTAFQQDGLLRSIGFTGLGAVHVHDLMHFASTNP